VKCQQRPANDVKLLSGVELCGIKGELNPKIKLDLNDSFCTLINKYNPHIF